MQAWIDDFQMKLIIQWGWNRNIVHELNRLWSDLLIYVRIEKKQWRNERVTTRSKEGGTLSENSKSSAMVELNHALRKLKFAVCWTELSLSCETVMCENKYKFEHDVFTFYHKPKVPDTTFHRKEMLLFNVEKVTSTFTALSNSFFFNIKKVRHI